MSISDGVSQCVDGRQELMTALREERLSWNRTYLTSGELAPHNSSPDWNQHYYRVLVPKLLERILSDSLQKKAFLAARTDEQYRTLIAIHKLFLELEKNEIDRSELPLLIDLLPETSVQQLSSYIEDSDRNFPIDFISHFNQIKGLLKVVNLKPNQLFDLRSFFFNSDPLYDYLKTHTATEIRAQLQEQDILKQWRNPHPSEESDSKG